jgi:hypothetical protein
MASTTTKAPKQAAAPAPKAQTKAIKTRLVVAKDSGRGSTPRVRNYEVRNRDTDELLGAVNEVWKDGKMEWQNSVKEGRRALSATDAKGNILGKDFGTRARAVAAVRRNAQA